MRTPDYMGPFAIFFIALFVAPAVQTFDLLQPGSPSPNAAAVSRCLKSMPASAPHIDRLMLHRIASNIALNREVRMCFHLVSRFPALYDSRFSMKPGTEAENNAENPTSIGHKGNVNTIADLQDGNVGSPYNAGFSGENTIPSQTSPDKAKTSAENAELEFPYITLNEDTVNLAGAHQGSDANDLEGNAISYPESAEHWPGNSNEDASHAIESYLRKRKDNLMEDLRHLHQSHPSLPLQAVHYDQDGKPFVANSKSYLSAKSKRGRQDPFLQKFRMAMSKRRSLSINNALQALSDMFHNDRMDRIQKNRENMKNHMYLQG